VQKLEAAIGHPIGESFRRFVSENDGAEPESNRFEIGDDNGSGVRRFIPVSKILEEREYIDNIPKHAYPIAEDSCGNYVLLDEGKGGQIYFWDHELPDDENIIKLADNFDAFLSMLERDDVEVKLQPGQVISSWEHPDFHKLVGKYLKKKPDAS
jgi:SMI1-KNR4 cell-wall